MMKHFSVYSWHSKSSILNFKFRTLEKKVKSRNPEVKSSRKLDASDVNRMPGGS